MSYMFREPGGKQLFEKDCLAATPINAEEVNMDAQKCYGDKDTGPFSSVNPSISVAAPKSLSSYMYSRSFLPTQRSSFA